MRKQVFCFRASIIIFFSAGLFLSAQAQRPTKTPITADQTKEFDKSPAAEDAMAKFSASEKSEGKEKAQAMAAFLVKALLHRIDPATYPIDDDEKSGERIALKAVERISAATLARAKIKVTAFVADGPKRAKLLGKFKDIDFKKKSITPDIKKVSSLKFQPTPRVTNEDNSMLTPRTPLTGVGGNTSIVDPAAPAYNYMDWILEAVYCVDETNPESGNDDIVIGGILVGASGNTKAANTLISCKFNDGSYCNHGSYPFGYVSLNTTNSWPKHFYLILQVVEVDSDEREAAAIITDIMNMAGAIAGGTYGALIAALSQAIDIFAGMFFDDDLFPQVSIPLTLGGPNVFGSDGKSDDWRVTVGAHGGTYRIRFRNQLR
jgi:hypothetical protein